MYVENVRDIIDQLIRMGLVKEVWYEGEDSPRYVATEKGKLKAYEEKLKDIYKKEVD